MLLSFRFAPATAAGRSAMRDVRPSPRTSLVNTVLRTPVLRRIPVFAANGQQRSQTLETSTAMRSSAGDAPWQETVMRLGGVSPNA